MIVARILAFLGGLILLAAIARAATQADIFVSFAMISADPWGLVAIVDLYLGFLLMAVVIQVFEGHAIRALLWIIPLVLFGNIVAALWLIVRGARHLRAHANMEDKPIAMT